MVVGNAYQFILDYHFINQNLNIVMSMKLICVIQVSCVFLCVLTYIIGTVQLNLNLMKLAYEIRCALHKQAGQYSLFASMCVRG